MDDTAPESAGSSSGNRRRSTSIPLGRAGEDAAARYLQAQGFEIIERNWRSPHTRHEIDLIARDGNCIVFVEVKTARTRTFGHPLEWITPRKQAAIIKAAQAFLAETPGRDSEFRFDAVGVSREGGAQSFTIEHVRNAFRVEAQ